MVYEGFKIYGPYKRKDGRQHVIAYKSQLYRYTISYPKYLMELHLSRYLRLNEDVHHKDGDISNNSLENLEVVDKRQHVSKHNQKYDFVTLYCVGCGKEVLLNPVQHRDLENNRRNKGKFGPYCSKSCIGLNS